MSRLAGNGLTPQMWVSRKLWRDRAEEMLVVAQTVGEETRALMKRLAADWLLTAAVEDERERPAHAPTR